MSKKMTFAEVCELMPPDIFWGEPLTPQNAREIVQAATAVALERAEKACDGINADYTARYVAAGATRPNNLDFLDGASDGAEECAAAIRALKDES